MRAGNLVVMAKATPNAAGAMSNYTETLLECCLMRIALFRFSCTRVPLCFCMSEMNVLLCCRTRDSEKLLFSLGNTDVFPARLAGINKFSKASFKQLRPVLIVSVSQDAGY